MAEEDSGIHVGVLVAHSPTADIDTLQSLARSIADEACGRLRVATDVVWAAHDEEPAPLDNNNARRAPDFLDEAMLRMVEGPYDVVVVLTNVPLVSRNQQVVAGLASPVGRVVVMSTRQLILSPRDEPVRPLDHPAVFWNGVTLLLHLMGHLLHLRHVGQPGTVMSPFRFDPDRRDAPPFGKTSLRHLPRRARRFPQRSALEGGLARELHFHVVSAVRNTDALLHQEVRSKGVFLPLQLPALATAALAPSFILMFTAEIWDVAIHMDDTVAWTFALVVILSSAVYLMQALDLYFPRKERRILTEHVAVVNVAVFIAVLLGIIGLFVMITALMLAIVFLVFPADLMREWPSLESPSVVLDDKVRLAAFTATIGVITGALAGGLESRTVVRQFALFLDEP